MTEPAFRRGEVWWCDFEPAAGSEARKNRPAVILGGSGFEAVPVRLVVPLTTWQARFARQPNKVRVVATPASGLYEESAADVLLTRGVSLERLGEYMGELDAKVVDDIAMALAVLAVVPR